MDQTREDVHESEYNDLEQEVKDAEPEKVQKIATKKATEAEAATAALTAAAGGDAITKNSAEAAEATVAAEAQDKDEEILALIQERKTTGKHEKERIRNQQKEKTKGRRGKKKNTEDIGRTHRNEEHLQHQDGKKANPHPKEKKQRRRNHQHKRRHCKCIR